MSKPTPYVRIPIREDEHKRLVNLQTALTGQIDSYLARPSLSDVIKYLLDQQESNKMNTSKYDYTVIEDNGGGLHLFLFRPGTEKIVMGFTGFEYTPGSLIESLDALDTGDNARSWDGKMEDAQAQWDYIHSHESGYQVICYSENGERSIKPEKMGRAGQIEFGVQPE